ncbi:MAG: sulfatase [Planctomycetota bacterium]
MRSALLILLLILAGMAAFFVFRRDHPLRGANVIVVVIDTLRRDHVDAPGNMKRNTECLNRIAKEGFVFERAIAPCTWTKPSVASLFTGLYPGRHGAVGTLFHNQDHMALHEDNDTLAEQFKKAGYRTGAFITNPHIERSTQFDQGFDTFEQPAGHAGALFERAFEWIRDGADNEAFFLYLHALDPHSPYFPPLPYRRLFLSEQLGPEAPFTRRGQYVEIMLFMEQYRQYEAEETAEPFQFDHDREWMRERTRRVAPNAVEAEIDGLRLNFGSPDDPALKERIDHLTTLYAAEVAYIDDMFEKFFKGLENLGMLDNTILVITSDHGEAFLEHDFWGHGHAGHAEEVDVPLLFWIPAGELPFQGRCEENVSLVDVAPTLFDLTGLDPPDELDGLSLKRIIEGRKDSFNQERPVFTENILGGGDFVSAQQEGKKIMCIALKGKEPQWELFDIRADPAELFPRNPDANEHLKRAVENLIRNRTLDEHKSAMPQELSEEEINQLRELGYL